MQRQSRTLNPTRALTATALVLAGMYALSQGFHFWATGAIYTHRELLGLTLASYLAGFGCLLAALVWRPTPRQAGWVVAGLVGLTALGRGYQHLRYVNPRYGTDAVAFNHYAAELVLEGKNPYHASMAPASHRFGVPRKYYTPDEKGRVVAELSYPSLSFLVYTPFVAAGLGNVNWVNLAFLLVAVFLAMLLAPAWAAPLMPLVFVIEPEFVNFSVGGVTDILFVPLLLGAVWAWDEHKDWSALLWGLACGIKQGPWFLAPFAAVAVAWDAEEGSRWRAVARFAGISAAAFLLPNLPFLATDPKAWFFGVFTPMGRKLVLYGSGLVTLTTTAGWRIPRAAYSLVSLTFLTVLLALFAQFYERLKPMLWLVPALVLWLAPRSFHSYYIYWVPVFALALAWHLSASPWAPQNGENPDASPKGRGDGQENGEEQPVQGEESTDAPPHGEGHEPDSPEEGATSRAQTSRFARIRIPPKWVPVLVALPFLLFAAAAVLSAARPVTLTVDRIQASDPQGLGVVTDLDLMVTNHSNHAVSPRFALAWSHNNFFFWFPDEQFSIPARATKQIRLHPKDPTQAPPLDEPFVLRVYDPSEPVFHLTRPVGPIPRSTGLFNGAFTAWDDVSNQPLSWIRAPSFVSAPGALTLGLVHGKKALCLRAAQSGENREWARTSLEQKVPAAVHQIGFESLVFQEPEGGWSPRILAGLEIQFPSNEIAVVVPQPGLAEPMAYRIQGTSRPLTLVHLPAPADLSKWSVHWVDLVSLARHFGYERAVPVRLRLLASRHASRPGTTKICFAWVGGPTDSWSKPGRPFEIQSLPALSNPELRFGTSGRPEGWRLEQPSGCRWGLNRDTGNSWAGSALELRVAPGNSEWCRLALTQTPIRPTGPISLQICSPRATKDPEQPKLIAGIEVAKIQGGPIHVWTLCDLASHKVQKLGRIRLHCLERDVRGCGVLSLDPSEVVGTPLPRISLVANLHRGTQGGALDVHFSPISLKESP